MKVLVVGSGAREHAIVRALLRDEQVTSVECAPGNAGIAQDVPVHPLDVSDNAAITALATALATDLVVIGPEAPLVAGAADAVRAAGIACFGPSAAAAQLEGSKAFAKEVMAEAGVPTAMARVCTNDAQVEEALDTLTRPGTPFVVKDRETREPLAPYGGTSPAMTELVAGCKKRGLLPFTNFNRMHVVPPATVTETEAKEGLAILDEVFSVVDAHYTGA